MIAGNRRPYTIYGYSASCPRQRHARRPHQHQRTTPRRTRRPDTRRLVERRRSIGAVSFGDAHAILRWSPTPWSQPTPAMGGGRFRRVTATSSRRLGTALRSRSVAVSARFRACDRIRLNNPEVLAHRSGTSASTGESGSADQAPFGRECQLAMIPWSSGCVRRSQWVLVGERLMAGSFRWCSSPVLSMGSMRERLVGARSICEL
jgi:hypothetical protein